MKKFLLSALCLGALSAQAAFVTQTFNTGALADTPVNANVNFVGFQTLVGAGFTLTGVTVTLDGQMTGTGSVTNTGNSPANASWSYQNGSGLTDMLISVGGNPMVNVVPVPSFTNAQVLLGVPAGGTANFTNRNFQDTQNTGLLTSGAIFNSFNVAGNIPVNFTANAFVQTGCSNGNCNFSLVTQSRGIITVRYDYEPSTGGIPEPSTMALLGSALVGLGLIARRRQA